MDDVTVEMSQKHLVELARTEEMQVFKEHDVYRHVPIEEATHDTGKQPSGVRWYVIKKGIEVKPAYRSRLVVK